MSIESDTFANAPARTPTAQTGFLGDYMWLAVDNKGRANMVWADTRGQGGSVEEDIYFARTP